MLALYLAVERLSQKQAAHLIGISESTLSRFLGGSAMPDAIGYSKILTWISLPEQCDENALS